MKKIFVSRKKSESGQVLVAGIFILIVLLLLVFAGFDIYNSLRAKFKIETGQESAALAGAAWQRESLNLIGEINLVKICSMLLEGDENWVVPLPRQENYPLLTPQQVAAMREDALRARIDVLTEMQTRVSFVGPLIGLAAAQQAAKANGIPVTGDFAHYINDLYQSARYRQEYGGAKTYINHYNWKQPYIDLIQTISNNGVAVYPNAIYSNSPNVYPPQLALESFYAAIHSKYAEILAAEGNAIYPQQSWGMIYDFVVRDQWAGRFANPPWWKIEYNRIAFPDESEIFTLGVAVGASENPDMLNEKWRKNTIDIANSHLSPQRIQSIYDPVNLKPLPLSIDFFEYDNTWYPSYYRENYDDYDEYHYNYWFTGDVLRKHVKPCYRYEGPAAYVESHVEVGKTTSIVKVSGQNRYRQRNIRIGSNRASETVSDFSDYRPGTIAKTLGALNDTDPPIALPVVLPVFEKILIMPTYMPIPYNFNVLRKNDSALKRFLMWLSTRENLDSNENLPAGCNSYLEALRILVKGPQFRYYGWNPKFNMSEFDETWRADLADWHNKRVESPSEYQYNLRKGQTLPGYLQEPNIFTACPKTTQRSGIVRAKDMINGGFASRHFIGNGTYMVVDSRGHIVNRTESDPTWDPECCGTCKCNCSGGSGGSWFGFNVTGNIKKGPPRM